MDNRFNKGDLVKLKNQQTSKPAIGIVIDILTRSDQNVDWDRMLVLMNGWIDAFPHRSLQSASKN
jgi:hypothetical protein